MDNLGANVYGEGWSEGLSGGTLPLKERKDRQKT